MDEIGEAMKEILTAVFEKSPYGYIGYVEELPGANTQGETLEETRRNLIEAVELVIQSNRQLVEEELSLRSDVIKEQLGNIAV
jgi:predicted RNase H-like HicB family nuclease